MVKVVFFFSWVLCVLKVCLKVFLGFLRVFPSFFLGGGWWEEVVVFWLFEKKI